MRYSRTRLAFKYLNRSSFITRAAISFLVGTMMTPWFVPVVLRDVRLALVGKTITATVTSKQIAALSGKAVRRGSLLAHGGGKRSHNYLNYEYKVNGRVYRKSEAVAWGRWNAASVGQRLPIVYLPEDPEIARAGDPIWQTGAMIPLGIGLIAWISGVISLVSGVQDIRQKVQLLAEGLPALGRIDDIKTSRVKGRTYLDQLAYTYRVDQEGEPTIHEAILTSNIPYLPGEIHLGDAVLVLYDPLDPTRQVLDCFEARPEDRARLLEAVRNPS